jgi:hypothetical protein
MEMEMKKNKKENKKKKEVKEVSQVNEIKESNKKTRIQLKDIWVFSEKTEQKYIDIKEHFYYLSLENHDENIYLNYVNQLHHQKKKETGTWDGFISLYESIKNQGFDFKNNNSIIIKQVNNHYCCLHGRHRICMMRHLYGENAIVTLKNDKVCKIKISKVNK